jgi:hypothetical protein
MRLSTIALTALGLANCSPPHTDRTAAVIPPEGVLRELASDEREYCERFLGSYKKGCHETFRANLAWRDLEITPGGQVAILVENKTSCGLAGCWLGLFFQGANGKFTQVFSMLKCPFVSSFSRKPNNTPLPPKIVPIFGAALNAVDR